MIYNASYEFRLNKMACKSSMLYEILIIACIIITSISAACFYFHWYVKGNYHCIIPLVRDWFMAF